MSNPVGAVAVMPGRNGGTLRRGGVNPNAGRKPAAIRKRALKLLAERLELVGHLADGVAVAFDDAGVQKLVSPRPGERLQALKLLAELGMGDAVSVSEVRERMRQQLAVIRTRETWTSAALIEALGEVWR